MGCLELERDHPRVLFTEGLRCHFERTLALTGSGTKGEEKTIKKDIMESIETTGIGMAD